MMDPETAGRIVLSLVNRRDVLAEELRERPERLTLCGHFSADELEALAVTLRLARSGGRLSGGSYD